VAGNTSKSYDYGNKRNYGDRNSYGFGPKRRRGGRDDDYYTYDLTYDNNRGGTGDFRRRPDYDRRRNQAPVYRVRGG